MTARLNPVIKLLMLVVFAVTVLMLTAPVYVLGFVTAAYVMKVYFKARPVWKRGIYGFFIAILLAQILFVPSGKVLLELWIIDVTRGGILNGIALAGRFLAIIMMSWVFVATTSPARLSSGFSGMGIPYRYSFLLVLAMRFVPVFQTELSNVREAQSLRGLRLGKGPGGIIRAARYTTVPMLVSALSKVHTLASSMEGRGFGAYPTRTELHPVRLNIWDLCLGVVSILLAFIIYGLNLAFPII